MNEDLLALTGDIVTAHLSHNSVPAADVPELIRTTFAALQKATQPQAVETAPQEPAVSIRASIKADHLVCLEDGKKLTMLKRYLRTNYDMSPEEYRAKWNLPRDYPMVAPDYAAKRRVLAESIGLGRKKAVAAIGETASAVGDSVSETVDVVAEPVVAAAKTGRKALGIAAAKAAAAAHLNVSDASAPPKSRAKRTPKAS